MKILVINLLILLVTIGCTSNKKAINPENKVNISLGEIFTIENHQVKFVKVLEDSRCPKGATCIWAGRAIVRLEILEEGKETIAKKLIFGQVKQGESKDLTLFSTEDKKVVGISLKPYPTTENSGSEKEYQLLVSIENNEK